MPDEYVPEVEDVSAMRREGDFSAFLRSRISKGPRGKPKPASSEPMDPEHVPGAWPSPRPLPPHQSRAPGEAAMCDCRQCVAYAKHKEVANCGCARCIAEQQGRG